MFFLSNKINNIFILSINFSQKLFKMSRLTCTAPAGGSIKDAANIDWNKVDIDELVDQLTPGEIQQLLEECDPDDPHLPPSARCTYHCDKLPTGKLGSRKT